MPRPEIFDGHNDLPWAHRDLYAYDLDRGDIALPRPELHTDLPRLRKGGVGAQFWSVFVPSQLAGDAAVTATLEQVDFVRRMIERYDDLVLARTAGEVEAAMADGRIASLLGMEGGHSINESLGTLRAMHALGVRYMTLTHNDNVPWADSATDAAVLGGLNDFGREVVREMNRIGMLVDLSHVSADVMRDALEVTSSPVVFSHSNARTVCDVTRNVPDDVLAELPSNGGVCMLTFVPMFTSPGAARWYQECLEIAAERGLDPRSFADLDPVMVARAKTDPPPTSTLDDVVAHIEHVREVAGVEHVGLGGDFDGTTFLTRGLEDVGCYPNLLARLAERGWSESELALLAHGNVLRVLRAAVPD
ncbi:dipeptidase [Solicola gregarius]|uniref:Dipeptidase n=1 Tax=Solicola gregarius TaxID=2908642 RepID=A0AA46TKU7_9ACTN|nr:dipeptidase [Solicola gregarius]UYM06769.1 dipeptidase [Solicola gregarius]